MKTKEDIKNIFDKFVLNYDMNNIRISNKYFHCYRVADICEKIALSIKEKYEFTDEEVELAYLIGILHDIARFDQAIKFNTFRDYESFDHGDYGEELLKNGLLRSFIEEDIYDNIILVSVKEHNKYIPSNEYTSKEKLFINLIRDADKLDIFYEFESGKIDIYKDIYDLDFSEEVLKQYNMNKLICRKYLNTKNDKILSDIALLYDLNYKYSFSYLKNEGYIDKIFNKLNITENAKEMYNNFRITANNYIDMIIEK